MSTDQNPTVQTSFVDPIEKIHRVLRQLADEDFDIVRVNLSGGMDSFIAAEAIRRFGGEYGIQIDMVAHYNTGTGIPSTTKTVQEYCAEHGLACVEGLTPKAKERVGPQVLDYGYYGAGEGRAFVDRKHNTAYILRKERVEDGLYAGFDGSMLSISGAYHDESDSRGGKMNGAIKWGRTGERKPRLTVASPIYALTSDEVTQLAEEWDVPKVPAYDTLGASGDCTGCAYDQAGRFYYLWGEAPHLAYAHATLMVWTQMRRARGDINLPPEQVIWGWGSLDDETIRALRADDPYYDESADKGPTSVDVAASVDEEDDEDTGRERSPVDHELREFTCGKGCTDRCEPAMKVALTDGGGA